MFWRREVQKLKDENEKLLGQVEVMNSFVNSVRSTLKRVMGEKFEALRDILNSDWAKDPANPDYKNPNSNKSSTRSSGPSR